MSNDNLTQNDFCSLCFKTREGPSDCNFFKVPKDVRRRKRWGEICRINFKKKVAWICKDHFLPSAIKKSGNEQMLLPNALPFISPIIKPEKVIEAAYKSSDLKGQLSENREEQLAQHNLNTNNVNLHQIHENFVLEIPVKKTVFCTRSTQTNTRLCGLVETSEFADDFRLNCFYCSDIFPFENWKDFTIHLKKKHFDKEKAFEVCEYVSEEHDYTQINTPSASSLEPVFETIGVSPESLLPFLGNEEEPTIPVNPTFVYTDNENMTVPENVHILNNLTMDAEDPLIVKQEYAHNNLESMDVTPAFYSIQDDKEELSVNVNILNTNKFAKSKKKSPMLSVPQYSKDFKNKSSKKKIFNMNQARNVSKQAPGKTILSRFLKRTIKEESDLDEKEAREENSGFPQLMQQNSPVISYEYSPNAIVYFLLDSMKNFPILWQFNTEPFNEDFAKTVEDMCQIINEKWSLNIDHLTMGRSINRVLRFYCYLFPNENIENIHKFTCYYDKCAEFLPLSVNEIAYARCSYCYICFKNDFDLKRHLLKERKLNLQWIYKCVECKETFKENDEYEFHKRLPHYIEVFRCEPCKKKYFRRNIYNRHISEYHSKENERKYKCDQCDKGYKTHAGLRGHQVYHGERKFKCHLCSKSYHEKAKLQLHLKTHRKEYDFICEVCAKEFVTQSALNVHMSKHTGEKITCTICDLKLRKSSLSRHLRLVHAPGNDNVTPIQLPKGNLKNYRRLVRRKPRKRRQEFEQRKYQCKICMLDFENYKPLAEHNKELHSDLPKWPCQLCSTVFNLKINLKRHYRKKHNLHVIQVYKLVEEGDDLSDVLSIQTEQLDILAKSGIGTTTLNMQIPEEKTEFVSEEENMQSFIIQEEIMETADNITLFECQNQLVHQTSNQLEKTTVGRKKNSLYF